MILHVAILPISAVWPQSTLKNQLHLPRVPQVGVLVDLCLPDPQPAQVSEYRDPWHPRSYTEAKTALARRLRRAL